MSVGEIAAEMDVGLEGMRSRLARIRQKAGGLPTDVIARMLADEEATHPSGVHPIWGPDASEQPPQQAAAVREERLAFFDNVDAPSGPLITGERRNPLSTLPRLVLIALVAVLFGMVVLQAVSLLRPAQEAGLEVKHQH